MSYKLIIAPKAEKEFNKIQKPLGRIIIKRIYDLMNNPRPNGHKKLTGYTNDRTNIKEFYRIRVGDYRVIYTIEQDIITITVVQIKKRGDIY